MLTDALHRAYLAALYRFNFPGRSTPVELRVGQRSDALQAWLREGSHQSATVLTAFNPEGYMQRRYASINDLPIPEAGRKFHWPAGRRPDDHPSLTDLGL